MVEASQRTAQSPQPQSVSQGKTEVKTNPKKVSAKEKPQPTVSSANYETLAFKVSPEFRKRFRRSAVEADLKLNELLFAAFEVWEKEQNKGK